MQPLGDMREVGDGVSYVATRVLVHRSVVFGNFSNDPQNIASFVLSEDLLGSVLIIANHKDVPSAFKQGLKIKKTNADLI